MRVDIEEKRYGPRIAIKDIHLNSCPGEAILFLGTSGAGKSTVFKCITGKTSFKGEISGYKKEDIGYIPQFPALNPEETVFAALFWSGLFSRKYKLWELHKVTRDLINMLGLSHVQNKKIKSLSGGQRQRVSIGKELIRGNDIIIADEIDTGLDPGTARGLNKKIVDITHDQKKTTIVISHNLTNINLFDKVVILVKDKTGAGRIAYFGSVDGMKEFFGTDDYCDVLVGLNLKSENGRGEADDYIKKFDRMDNGRIR